MRRQRTWVLVAALILIAFGGALVIPGVIQGMPGRDGDVVSGSDARAVEAQPSSPATTSSSADDPSPTASPSDAPEGTRRLTVSRPDQGHRGSFEARSRRTSVPGVQQGRVAHPERALFEPTAVSFVTGAEAAQAPVDPVETLADGTLELPVDPQRIGWWTGGSAAGAPYGSVVLAGHLDSRNAGLGFAARMTGLSRGDAVVLSDGGRERRYRVVTRYLLPRKRLEALTALFSGRGAPRLVLLTCGGAYDAARGAYTDNLVVEAVPLP